MVDSICLDEKRVLPCTAYLDGEYGIRGLYMGVPVKLGAERVEEIVKLRLTRGREEDAPLLGSSGPRGRRRPEEGLDDAMISRVRMRELARRAAPARTQAAQRPGVGRALRDGERHRGVEPRHRSPVAPRPGAASSRPGDGDLMASII